ncbi:hypothetical protein [Leucobacter coleopterorum]|uniref:hypothetical protein n=1 Tax=Leucobacter coleopterorum TaxID=2714933 RepID=UPI003CC6DF9E
MHSLSGTLSSTESAVRTVAQASDSHAVASSSAHAQNEFSVGCTSDCTHDTAPGSSHLGMAALCALAILTGIAMILLRPVLLKFLRSAAKPSRVPPLNVLKTLIAHPPSLWALSICRT